MQKKNKRRRGASQKILPAAATLLSLGGMIADGLAKDASASAQHPQGTNGYTSQTTDNHAAGNQAAATEAAAPVASDSDKQKQIDAVNSAAAQYAASVNAALAAETQPAAPPLQPTTELVSINDGGQDHNKKQATAPLMMVPTAVMASMPLQHDKPAVTGAMPNAPEQANGEGAVAQLEKLRGSGSQLTVPPADAKTPAFIPELGSPLKGGEPFHDEAGFSFIPTPPGSATAAKAPSWMIVPNGPEQSVAMGSMMTVPTTVPASTEPAQLATDVLIEALRARAKARPQELRYALALAMLQSAEDPKRPLDPAIEALAPNDQKIVTDLLQAVSTMVLTPAVANQPLADRVAPIVKATEQWQADAELKLPRLALATRVDSFGVYTPVEPKFTAGERHTVIIYCEVANFAADRSPQGFYQTHLTQQETLFTDDGLLIYRPNVEDVEDRSLNRRRDFYLVKKLTLPETLPAGKYTLRMSVTDKITNHIAQATLPVEIVGG